MKPSKQAPSRTTCYRYRKEGLDVTTDGKIDLSKAQAIYDEKRLAEQERGTLSKEEKYWDTRFRKARALKLEQEREVANGVLVRRDDVTVEVIRRELAIKGAVLGLCRTLPPLLVGKKSPSIASIIHEHMARVFNRLAKTL